MTIQDYVEELSADIEGMADVYLANIIDIGEFKKAMLSDSAIINESYSNGVPVEACTDILITKHVHPVVF